MRPVYTGAAGLRRLTARRSVPILVAEVKMMKASFGPRPLLAAALLFVSVFPAAAQSAPAYVSVLDQWSTVPVPPAPQAQSVTVDPATTALLVLDLQNQLCNPEKRPRAWSTVPFVADLLHRARASGALVVYSLVPSGAPGDIVAPLAPQSGEPVVRSSADKFFRTDLESILAGRGIKTVIVTGTAANGAVANTATGASLRGMKVVVPVDGMSNEDLYAEQYVVYHLLNSPGTRANATVSRSDLISFGP
jgi:nicotinamidase-related amidase